MPRIIQAKEFRDKMGRHIKTLEQNDPLIVANEIYVNNSFIVTSKDKFLTLISDEDLKDGIEQSFEIIKEKVSERNRRKVNKRYKK